VVRVSTLWVTPGRTEPRADVDLAVLQRRLCHSSGREGTLWPVAGTVAAAVLVAVILVTTEPVLAAGALLWTLLMALVWVGAVLVERPPFARPRISAAAYRPGSVAGDVLASAAAGQVRSSLALLRKAHTLEIGRDAVLATVPTVAPPWPVHLAGRSWHEVPVPPERHACWPQTVGVLAASGLPFERCPCGGQRPQRPFAPWEHRNERVADRVVLRLAGGAEALPPARGRHARRPRIVPVPVFAPVALGRLGLAGRALTSHRARLTMAALTLSVPLVLLVAGTTSDTLVPFLQHRTDHADRGGGPGAVSRSSRGEAPPGGSGASGGPGGPAPGSPATISAPVTSPVVPGSAPASATSAGGTAAAAAPAGSATRSAARAGATTRPPGGAGSPAGSARSGSSAGSGTTPPGSGTASPGSGTTSPGHATTSATGHTGAHGTPDAVGIAAAVGHTVSSVAAPVVSAASSVAAPVVRPVVSAASSVAVPVVRPVASAASSVAAPVVRPVASAAAPVVKSVATPVASIAPPLAATASLAAETLGSVASGGTDGPP
jgi:hypothetical protein